MANTFQRIIYQISNVVPLVVMTAIVWYLQYESLCIPLILIAVAIVITILFAVCFSYGTRNCSKKEINVSSITSIDYWLVAYVITYITPFSYIVIDDIQVILLIVIIFIILLIIISGIITIPNVLLFCVGYHFYKIKTDSTGVSDYLLITKRKRIRNKNDVNIVIRIFEKLLIDTKGD
ncbi:MAG: hypothetical protein LBC73_00120 [Oscillospiraceae bacterium]|jgi:hypothetical protein|nr:hypothetical protein [Oscillospiraceae bacterium]